MSETSGRIRELDGWRAVAAAMVLASHFIYYQHGRLLVPFPRIAPRVNLMGYLGVQIFFVISGFVICRLLLREEKQYGTFSLKAFYIRRVFRILPPFYLYLIVISVLAALKMVEATGKDVAKAALFLMDFHRVSAPWMTGHAWSLAVEEQFYLFFPALLWVTPRRWRSIVCGAVCALCIVWAFTIPLGVETVLVPVGVVVGFVCIFCGVLIGLHEEQVRRVVARAPSFVALVLLAMLVAQPVVRFENWKPLLFQAFVVPPSIAIMLLSTMERKSLFRSFLCWRSVQAVGVTSYALYLWQELFTAPRRFYHGLGHILPYLLPIVVIIVPASWILIEKPAIKFGRILSRRVRSNGPLLPPSLSDLSSIAPPVND